MTSEIELKLAVASQIKTQLPHILSHFLIIETDEIFLNNDYYDTPDYWLASQKMGLRMRQQNGEFTLTLKTNGTVVGGLHSRPEYNLTLSNGQMDFEALITKYNLPFDSQARYDFRKIFSTDFQRQTWLIDYQNAHIELAFDQGEVKTGGKNQPICELEFELKQGELPQLTAFVSEFLNYCDTPLHFDSTSKAKRGYRLLQKTLPQPKDWLEQWRNFVQLPEDKILPKFTALLTLEQGLIEETLSLGAEHFAQDFLTTVERIGAFFNLFFYYVENEKCLKQVAMVQLEKGNALPQEILNELLATNQQYFDEMRGFIRLHSETKDNFAVIEQLIALLQTPRYAQRLLNLITFSI